ncbi:hypothetical protein PoHVEF18_006777 [Penicillium ochrochloron]
MSGILNEAFTPCPSRSRSSGLSEHGGNESFDSLVEDDSAFDATGHIEFTTEVRAPTLTGVRPRRANRATNTVQIYEDTSDKQPGLVEKRRRPNAGIRDPSDRKSTLLAQPAQRFRPKVNFAPSPPFRQDNPETERQPSTNDGSRSVSQSTQKALSEDNNDLKKNVRRNTVYIPPDDTTVASVFMGLFSPVKKSHGNSMPQVAEDTQVNTIEAQIAKRQVRKSAVVSARKAPLQPSAKIAQEAAFRVDVAGKNGGKENIPPGSFLEVNQKIKLDHTVQSKPKRMSTATSKPARRTTMHKTEKGHGTNSAVGAKKQPPKRNALGEKQTNVHASSISLSLGRKVRGEPQDPLRNASASLKARASVLSERLGHSQTLRASKIGNTSTLKELNNQYPVLAENISKPALYEDDWLSHQETVITQLINALFECTNRDSTVADSNALRLELLGLYHTEEFLSLYERLKSSLSYGTLRLPNNLQARNSRLKYDVGLRREFFDIWIQSYDLHALVPALETVVGRRISSDSALFNLQSDPPFETDFKAQRAHELQEFDYTIDNIAVDLRDGVRLTRLVEILFYTSEHMRTDLDDQTEVTLSSGEALSLLGDERDLPLSKHLKYPCISRAAKIYNVQIALSALTSVNGGRNILGDVIADHIVDGYREKTVALLWTLVSKFGLAGLVDWEDLRKEIGRLQRKATLQLGQDWVKQEAWFTQNGSDHSSLLLQWARILAAMKGLEIRNMTTSFADGRIYGAIVDEYEPFITGRETGDSDFADRCSVSMPLASRLRLLECSSQFASLVSPGKTSSHLLAGDFTLGTLAFLCSRLLSASRRARAAVVLQRFWRTHLAKRDESRRKIAHDLAAHCAAVVQTRNQIIWAKDVITRSWRNYQTRKQRANNTRYRALEKAKRQQRKTAGRRL